MHQYKDQHPQITLEVQETAKAALKTYVKKNIPDVSSELPLEDYNRTINTAYAKLLDSSNTVASKIISDDDAKLKMHLKIVLLSVKAIQVPLDEVDAQLFYGLTEDIMLLHLDSIHGSSIDVTNRSIFTRLTKIYEARFMEDIKDLNCLMPDVITRVSEYVPNIVSFVEKIVGNGFAYKTSDGSVYFDIHAFEKANHFYARLEPWNRSNKALQADGEGALSGKSAEKRSDADFALWKASKPGEPSWPSPWGDGRPGWHIECSAMASDVLGQVIDIHSGGIDLAFPHHDNELAQSEAYWHSAAEGNITQPQQWVNYFLHMGHLSIQGSKMSKSLKNFTTIKEALSKGEWNPRGLRVIFLITGWKEGAEITPSLIKAGQAWEDKVNNFFLKAKDMERTSNSEDINRSQDVSHNNNLKKDLECAKTAVHAALCDSFDAPAVMRIIADLITKFNSYDSRTYTKEAALEIARWITQIVRIFGLDVIANNANDSIGWSGIDIPENAIPYIFTISKLRDKIRKVAVADNLEEEKIDSKEKAILDKEEIGYDSNPFATALKEFQEEVNNFHADKKSKKDYLALCDRLRDHTLWNLGIYLEDRDGQPALVRPVDQELRKAREERAAIEAAKAKAKEERRSEAIKRDQIARIDPAQMFRTNEYSAWDEDGLPTKDREGEMITKSRTKKLKKDMEKQKKLHETWLVTQKI